MIRFTCPQCGKGFQAEDKAGGKKTKCPKCTAAITVPLAETIGTSAPAVRLACRYFLPAAARAKDVFDDVHCDVDGLANEPPRPCERVHQVLSGTKAPAPPSTGDPAVGGDKDEPKKPALQQCPDCGESGFPTHKAMPESPLPH